jgi:hypothetical protein
VVAGRAGLGAGAVVTVAGRPGGRCWPDGGVEVLGGAEGGGGLGDPLLAAPEFGDGFGDPNPGANT